MRARNIKPGFFKNDELAEVPPIGRLLFVGLWCMADREGRLENRPKKIKAEVLPYDNCDVAKLLNELSEKKFIIQYKVSGCNYIQIINFKKHQSPHIKEQESTIPAPDLHQTCTSLESLNPDMLIPDILIPDIPDSGSRPVHKPKSPRKTPQPEKSLLPQNFCISPEVTSWAKLKGHTRLDEHFENFCDLARSKGYAYVDWDSAFKKAVRENWARLPPLNKDNGANKCDLHPERKAISNIEGRWYCRDCLNDIDRKKPTVDDIKKMQDLVNLATENMRPT